MTVPVGSSFGVHVEEATRLGERLQLEASTLSPVWPRPWRRMTSGIDVSSSYDDGVNRVNGRDASVATIVATLATSALLDVPAQEESATMHTKRRSARLIRVHAISASAADPRRVSPTS
jgi:hypothetical protein